MRVELFRNVGADLPDITRSAVHRSLILWVSLYASWMKENEMVAFT